MPPKLLIIYPPEKWIVKGPLTTIFPKKPLLYV